MALTYGGLKQHILLALGGQPSIVTGVTKDQRIAEIINQSATFLFSKPWKFRERTARPVTLVAAQNWAALPGDAEEIVSLVCKAGLGWSVNLTTPDHIELLRNTTDPSLDGSVFFAAMSRPWAQSNGTTPLVAGSGMPAVQLDLYPTPQTSTADALIIRYRASWVAVSDVTASDYIVPVPAYVESLLIAYARAFALAYEDEGLSARLIEIDNGPLYNTAAIKDGIQQRDYGRLMPSRVGPFRGESYAVSSGVCGVGGVLAPASAFSNIRWRGVWNPNELYAVGDVVRDGTSAWIAVTSNSNVAPPASQWELMTTDGVQGVAGATGPTGATGVVSYVQFIATVDVAMTTANQVYTVASISLPAGTWMINGQTVLMQGASAGSAAMTMFIYNATTPANLASTSAHKASVTSTSQGLNCSVVVVLTTTTSIDMKAVSSVAAYTARYLSTTGNYDGATNLYALRIA